MTSGPLIGWAVAITAALCVVAEAGQSDKPGSTARILPAPMPAKAPTRMAACTGGSSRLRARAMPTWFSGRCRRTVGISGSGCCAEACWR